MILTFLLKSSKFMFVVCVLCGSTMLFGAWYIFKAESAANSKLVAFPRSEDLKTPKVVLNAEDLFKSESNSIQAEDLFKRPKSMSAEDLFKRSQTERSLSETELREVHKRRFK